MKRQILVAVFMANACSCCWFNDEDRYKGNGALRAISCWPTQNYTLNLGPIELGNVGTTPGHMGGLPRMEWVAGFVIPRTPTDPLCPEMQRAPWATAVVEMVLNSADGREVFSQRAALKEWTWTYGVGNYDKECYVYSQSSYFTPGSDSRYNMATTVVTSRTGAPPMFIELKTVAVYAP